MLGNRWVYSTPLLLLVCCLVAAHRYGLKGCKIHQRYIKRPRITLTVLSSAIFGVLLIADSIRGIAQWLIDAGVMIDALSDLVLPPLTVIALSVLHGVVTYALMWLCEKWSRRHVRIRQKRRIATCAGQQPFRALLECDCPKEQCPMAYNEAEKLLYNLDAVREALQGPTTTVYLGRDGKLSTKKDEGLLEAQTFTIPAKRIRLHRPIESESVQEAKEA